MIRDELIFTDLEFITRDDILMFCVKQLAQKGLIEHESKFITEINKREKEIPTSLGLGVAVPHARCKEVRKSFILFIRLKEAILWDVRNSEKVDLIFMIGVPEVEEAGQLHLRILSEISKKLIDEKFRDELRLSNENQIFDLLNQINIAVEGGKL